LKALSDGEIRKEFFIHLKISCFSGYPKFVKNLNEPTLNQGFM
jgi:hypothetical protein